MTLPGATRRNLFHPKKDSLLLGDWHGADSPYTLLRIGQRFINLPVYAKLESNALLVGPPRSGKGSGIILCNALRWDRVVMYEPNGESAAVALKHFRDAGFYVACINAGNLHREAPYLTPSHGFNVIGMLDPDLPDFGSLCHWVGGLLVERTGNEHDPFWVSKPEGVAGVLAMFIRVAESPDRQNLATFREIIMADNAGWKTLVSRMKGWCADIGNQKRYGHLTSILLNRANEISRAISVENNRTWESVLSVLESFTIWLDDPAIRECIQRTDIDFERFKSADKAALLFMVDGNFAKAHGGFGRMFVAATVLAMRRKPLAKSRALMILDEFPTLHYPDIVTTLATAPKYRLSVQICIQATGQVKNLSEIEGLCEIRQYLAANDIETARHVSDLCGVATVETETISDGRVTKHFIGRPLMTPGEVLTLHERKQIAFVRAKSPLMLGLRPYWERPLFSGKFFENPFFKGTRKGLRPWWPAEVAIGTALRVAGWFLGPSKTVAIAGLLLAAALVSEAGIRIDAQDHGAVCEYQTVTGREWWSFRGMTCPAFKIGKDFYG